MSPAKRDHSAEFKKEYRKAYAWMQKEPLELGDTARLSALLGNPLAKRCLVADLVEAEEVFKGVACQRLRGIELALELAKQKLTELMGKQLGLEAELLAQERVKLGLAIKKGRTAAELQLELAKVLTAIEAQEKIVVNLKQKLPIISKHAEDSIIKIFEQQQLRMSRYAASASNDKNRDNNESTLPVEVKEQKTIPTGGNAMLSAFVAKSRGSVESVDKVADSYAFCVALTQGFVDKFSYTEKQATRLFNNLIKLDEESLQRSSNFLYGLGKNLTKAEQDILAALINKRYNPTEISKKLKNHADNNKGPSF